MAGVSAGTAVSGAGHAWSPTRMPGGRAVLIGRACGLAAGTVLACGSVLASAVHVGDGSLAGEDASLPSYIPPGPAAQSGAPVGYLGMAAQRPPAAPDAVSAQAVVRTTPELRRQPARVHRNNPMSITAPAERGTATSPTTQAPWRSPAPSADPAPSGPIAPVNPVLDPAASGVGRVAPVAGVLQPGVKRDEQPAPASTQAVVPGTRAAAPLLKEATQPAMTMLGALLPMN
ncbi:MAG: hypothetical protein ACRDST_10895 [Pseudonocardiaceae bacterium]